MKTKCITIDKISQYITLRFDWDNQYLPTENGTLCEDLVVLDLGYGGENRFAAGLTKEEVLTFANVLIEASKLLGAAKTLNKQLEGMKNEKTLNEIHKR